MEWKEIKTYEFPLEEMNAWPRKYYKNKKTDEESIILEITDDVIPAV